MDSLLWYVAVVILLFALVLWAHRDDVWRKDDKEE